MNETAIAMLNTSIDHIVITSASLGQGVEWVQQTLGVSMQPGGEHPRMGTHNFLLKLGDTLFLEVIAINPKAAAPNRARWFQLDELDSTQPARLATWVVRTNDIHAAVSASSISLGDIEPMSRGSLNWSLTIPQDGSLPLYGIAPALIQWDGQANPANGLQDSGCSLLCLEAFYAQPGQITTMLEQIGFEDEFRISRLAADQSPYLIAHIQTPHGLRQLGGK